MAKKLKNKQKLTVGEIAAYSLGSLGREFSNNCINAFFLVYLCIYQGLNPMVLTVAFVLAKLWDAVNDPMLATIVNNTKKSKGFFCLLQRFFIFVEYVEVRRRPQPKKRFY